MTRPRQPPSPRPPRQPLGRRLASTLELPEDVILDLPRVTVLGGLQVTVENHKGIVLYSPERVVVGMTKGRIHISGRELVIGVIHEEEITVSGIVEGVTFERMG